MMKKDKDEPQGVWDYQTVAAQPAGKKFTADKFCRSCGGDLPKRTNPIGIQFFYCSQECAFDAAVHAAAKGYASHLYVKSRQITKSARQIGASHNSGERLPSSDAAESRADTKFLDCWIAVTCGPPLTNGETQ